MAAQPRMLISSPLFSTSLVLPFSGGDDYKLSADSDLTIITAGVRQVRLHILLISPLPPHIDAIAEA